MKQPEDLVIGHDYLIQMGGAERVVASMLRKWPRSPVYTSAVKRATLLPEFRQADIRASWMQRLPGIERHFKKYFAIYPAAFRSFGVIDAPVAWVSASTFAKCLRFTPRTASILYCHNPTRFLWQAEDYADEVRSGSLSRMVELISPVLRSIDRAAARRFDVILANSENVRRRIARCYDRDAEVLYPPVDVDRFQVTRRDGQFYLIVSRLVAYKSIQRAIEACNALKRRLVIVGDGPDRNRLKSLAGPTVEFRGHVADEEVKNLMQTCTGLIFPGEEDFGIAPVEEAAACGKPVLAFKAGGAIETVIEGETGRFFDQTSTTLADAIQASEATVWNPDRIRANAERFSESCFHDRMSQIIGRALEAKQQSLAAKPASTNPNMQEPMATSTAA